MKFEWFKNCDATPVPKDKKSYLAIYVMGVADPLIVEWSKTHKEYFDLEGSWEPKQILLWARIPRVPKNMKDWAREEFHRRYDGH